MTYLREFKVNWIALLGATLGVALGSGMNHYMANLFAPALLNEFGWEKSQFALVGTLGLASMPLVPLWGKFIDRFGARVSATIGFIVMPLSFLAFSMMSGNIYEYFAIALFQHVFGVLTTSLVFSRVIVQKFDLARGMALSVLMSGPPLIGALIVPVVGQVVDEDGWRAGYRLLALLALIGGVAAVTLIGKRPQASVHNSEQNSSNNKTSAAVGKVPFKTLLRHPAFLLLVGGMFFVNIPQSLVSSQLKLVLMESGAASTLATMLVSLYATGVVIGRFICGFALDRMSAQKVALITLSLPAVGFLVLASPLQHSWLLSGSVLLIGLAQGAEGDVGAYLTSRTFDIGNFSLVYSFMITSMGLAAALGSLVLSITLHATERFDLFLIISAAITLVGALCFFLVGRDGGEKIVLAPEPDAQIA